MEGTPLSDHHSFSVNAPTAAAAANSPSHDLHQAFIQSMQQVAQQQHSGAQPSPENANNQGNATIGNVNQLNAAAAPNPAAQQFGQLFGNLTTVQAQTYPIQIVAPAPAHQAQGKYSGTSQAAQAQAGGANINTNQAAQAQQGNNMISQLVASLQVQQQAPLLPPNPTAALEAIA